MGNAPSDSSPSEDEGLTWYASSSEDEDEEDSLWETTEAREVAGGAGETAGLTTVSTVNSQTGATSASGQQEEEEPALDQCGLEPGGGEWEEVVPDPPIRSSRLTAEEQAKFRGHLTLIFSEDALLGKRLVFAPADVIEVMQKVIPYLESELMLIDDVPFDVVIVADLHGQLHDLHRIFDEDAKDGKPGWECMKYVFLGDYVDRGRQSLEIVMALFCIKMLYPDRIFLLRGNHEFLFANVRYGFPLEIQERYTDFETAKVLFGQVNITFCYLSVAAIVGNVYYCSHAGISPSGYTRRLMQRVRKPYLLSQNDVMLHDSMWSDPVNGLRGTTFNTDRGSSIYFGLDEMAYALYNMDCIGLFRGHSMMIDGFDVVGGMCVSLFSCVGQSNNKGAVAYVDATGRVTVRVLEIDHARVEWDAELLRLDGEEPDYEDEKTRFFPDPEPVATGRTPMIVG